MKPGSNAPIIQVFGTRKCQETRKALRFFKERGAPVQEIDIQEKAPSPGELRAVAQAVGGVHKLLDREGKRFQDKGLRHALLGDPDIERLLLADPLLLRTPLVRRGKSATVGHDPTTWAAWLTPG